MPTPAGTTPTAHNVAAGAIDRERLVRRHNPVLRTAAPTATLSVGNGDCALTADVSGLQTFPAMHALRPDPHRVVHDGRAGLPDRPPRAFDAEDYQIPIQTQSTWAWYSTRPTRPLRYDDAVTVHTGPRGPVPYADRMGLQRAGDPIPAELEAGGWFHFNPRRLHLGRLALVRTDEQPLGDATALLEDPRAELDLWTGTISAHYRIDGIPVQVTTLADPVSSTFATRISSPLLRHGWGVAWIFDPQSDDLASFEHPLRESTSWTRHSPGAWSAHRSVEDCDYLARISTNGSLDAMTGAEGAVATTSEEALEVVVELSPAGVAPDMTCSAQLRPESSSSSFDTVRDESRAWWENYWTTGAAISLEGSTDPRAYELERRVVQSQYLTAVHCAGHQPPAETGLLYNTWSGKFHLEMHWWHGAHFPLWGRGELLERSLGWYHSALEAARTTARDQGYRGARWPKQTDPAARESPSNIGVFLLWQQPHLIHLLELLHAEGRGQTFLKEHYILVEETAEFMADVVELTAEGAQLPPPLIPAQESYVADRATVRNPTFELAYWSWGLNIANDWRRRLGLTPREEWQQVADSMYTPARMPDGTYAAISTSPHLIRKDHPSMLMAYGWLPPTELIDPEAMAETLESVWENWDLQSTWGWDYPVMAMTAARLGALDRAFNALLLDSPKNVYLPGGHNPQMPGFLSLYLPANGGLLAAMAHIAAALEGGAAPASGWQLTAEGFPSPSERSQRRVGPVARQPAPGEQRAHAYPAVH